MESIESTQAGVEYFCESSPEADAEMIALACQTMKDLGFTEITIEIGHPGFFNELIQELNLIINQTKSAEKVNSNKECSGIRSVST